MNYRIIHPQAKSYAVMRVAETFCFAQGSSLSLLALIDVVRLIALVIVYSSLLGHAKEARD